MNMDKMCEVYYVWDERFLEYRVWSSIAPSDKPVAVTTTELNTLRRILPLIGVKIYPERKKEVQ